MSEQGEQATVEIPADVRSQIADRVEHTEFADVNAYVTHVLEEVLHQASEDNDLSGETVDEEQVEERLKSLGYLNE